MLYNIREPGDLIVIDETYIRPCSASEVLNKISELAVNPLIPCAEIKFPWKMKRRVKSEIKNAFFMI